MSETASQLGLGEHMLMINSHRAEVAQGGVCELGTVPTWNTDSQEFEPHVQHIFAPQVAGKDEVVVTFVYPRRPGITYGGVHALSSKFGYRPAGLHETKAALAIHGDWVCELFRGVDIVRRRGIGNDKLTQALALVCFGSFVNSPNGQLIPVLALEKGKIPDDSCLHLRKLTEADFVRPAQMVPLVRDRHLLPVAVA